MPSRRNRILRFGSSAFALTFAVSATVGAQSAGDAPAAPNTGSGSGSAGIPPIYGAPGGGNAGATKDINSYLPSSSQPRTDGKNDSFDLNKSSEGGSKVLTGSGAAGTGSDMGVGGFDFGSVSIADGGKSSSVGRAVPEFHMVKQGDTLWGISSNYFANPWEWPRVWSLNPQVENPHWIYPGDQLRLGPKSTGTSAEVVPSDDNRTGRVGFIGGQRAVPAGTVFLRDQGYIGDPERDVWGEIVGGYEEKMLLTEQDTVYLQMKDGAELRIGQRLTIFKEVRAPEATGDARKPDGEIVKVLGTVRIDTWDKDARVARGKLIETLDVIERGAKVGPVGRRFDVVPPKPAKEQIEAHVLTSIYPNVFFASNQIVFIDKGKEDGLVPGNRLKALRRGDTWRHTLENTTTYNRSRVQMDSPDRHVIESTPQKGDEESFPDEVVGELMVVRVEDYSATCIVLEAKTTLEPGDRLSTIKGY